MKTYEIKIEITCNDDPSEWNWHELFDFRFPEEFHIYSIKEKSGAKSVPLV